MIKDNTKSKFEVKIDIDGENVINEIITVDNNNSLAGVISRRINYVQTLTAPDNDDMTKDIARWTARVHAKHNKYSHNVHWSLIGDEEKAKLYRDTYDDVWKRHIDEESK